MANLTCENTIKMEKKNTGKEKEEPHHSSFAWFLFSGERLQSYII